MKKSATNLEKTVACWQRKWYNKNIATESNEERRPDW